MLSLPLQSALSAAERSCGALASALLDGEPSLITAASTALRQTAGALSDQLQRSAPIERQDKNLQWHLKKISAALASQRGNLLRRSATVELALNTLLPATRRSTYGQLAPVFGSGTARRNSSAYMQA